MYIQHSNFDSSCFKLVSFDILQRAKQWIQMWGILKLWCR